MRHSPVDHHRTATHDRDESMPDAAPTPGLVVVCAAALAFVVCVANFALGQARAGVTAAIVAMLAFGAGLAWLAMDRRRIRQEQREWVIGHPGR
ncbi:LapA family protein [Mycobacterium intracellulare]|uniref:LapA family protein n=1 Tax=Mycobacterium intracellulare TaxID=1767 RepID=UPI001EEE263E|nr:LapA family protein [Mycobacterium intracellulare]MEE3752854.1 LapA family protein [Mycobacterium intracellulare]